MIAARALLSRDPAESFTVENIDIDEPHDDEILVRMKATGICHTDLVARRAGSAERPVLLGHEGAGVVESVGRSVRGIDPGDHVVLTFRHCGVCGNCRQGRPAYCVDGHALNQFGVRADGTSRVVTSTGAPVLDGFFGQSSFSEFALTRQDNTVVVDRDIDLAVAAPLGCSVQTGAGAVLNVLKPRSGDTVVVHGAGGVGMAAVLAAITTGARVIAVERSSARRELASSLGAHVVIDPASEDARAALLDATDGGATHAIDTTGNAEVIVDAMAALGKGGTLAIVALGRGVLQLDLLDTVLSGRGIRGCLEGDAVPQQFIPALAEMYSAGALPVDRLITRYPYDRIDSALGDHRRGDTVKPVLEWP